MSTSICLNPACGKTFSPSKNSTGKYCSSSCAAKINNSLYPKKRKIQKNKACLYCGEMITETRERKYCSCECSNKGRVQLKIERWLAGEDAGSMTNGELSPAIRRYLLTQSDNKCSRPECGWSVPNPYIGKVILTIEHRDGNYANNQPENLEVLCYNCHTLTATFGGLNKGNGRKYRYAKKIL